MRFQTREYKLEQVFTEYWLKGPQATTINIMVLYSSSQRNIYHSSQSPLRETCVRLTLQRTKSSWNKKPFIRFLQNNLLKKSPHTGYMQYINLHIPTHYLTDSVCPLFLWKRKNTCNSRHKTWGRLSYEFSLLTSVLNSRWCNNSRFTEVSCFTLPSSEVF